MENRVNYFFVGIFIFGLFFASLAFILWLGGYSKKESFKYYEIYTQESVAGLGIKAPVRLLGVEVGSVEKISIEERDSLGVKILIKVKKNTPIKQDTYATLQLQGITGLKFIQLQGGSKESPELTSHNKNKPPIIQFKESFLAAIDKQSEHIFSLVKTADLKTKELLSEQNLKNLELILNNLAQISSHLNENSQKMSQNITNASFKLGQMADNISLAAKNFNEILKSVKEGVIALNSFAKKANSKIDSYDDLKQNIEQNLELLNKVLLESDLLIKNLQRSPSDILFKQEKPQLGPGER
ncbi:MULTISPECIES: MlaD family protein [Campylobacter]|uniref:MCE family protein n=1 Tax=Campylobacter taeniopygiae TaxID=2510188 RepID=A0ABY2TKY5_9BACT|nr:MlaD family protein [Campylobacter taeniopygiae]MBZ7935629.1 MCE family protein [Campylobacter sp. B0100352/1]MBZ7964044.1 MCE family protein [Campylobacter sp. 2457A]TKX34786.1 MCE family protein [Campylobacter taeniopygiae]